MQFKVADIKLLPGRKGQAQAEPAHAANLPYASIRANAVNLSQFAARPECPVSIERQSLRMVESFSECPETFQGNQRAHTFGRLSFVRQANILLCRNRCQLKKRS